MERNPDALPRLHACESCGRPTRAVNCYRCSQPTGRDVEAAEQCRARLEEPDRVSPRMAEHVISWWARA